MKCAYCKYNDGVVYTSIPPKYRCTITNEFHLALDDCNVEFAPVKHGRWLPAQDYSNGNEDIECSNCGEWFKSLELCGRMGEPNYCPVCGTKMDWGEQDA